MGTCDYLNENEKSKEELAIAMPFEPTIDTIHELEFNVRKGTELEIILMDLKYITTKYNKERVKKKNDKLSKINSELNQAEHNGNLKLSQELILKIGKLGGNDCSKMCYTPYSLYCSYYSANQ